MISGSRCGRERTTTRRRPRCWRSRTRRRVAPTPRSAAPRAAPACPRPARLPRRLETRYLPVRSCTSYLSYNRIFFLLLETISPFHGITDSPVFELLVMSALCFKARVDFDSRLVQHLLTSLRPVSLRIGVGLQVNTVEQVSSNNHQMSVVGEGWIGP